MKHYLAGLVAGIGVGMLFVLFMVISGVGAAGGVVVAWAAVGIVLALVGSGIESMLQQHHVNQMSEGMLKIFDQVTKPKPKSTAERAADIVDTLERKSGRKVSSIKIPGDLLQ